MAQGSPVVTKEDDVWVIRVENENGKTHEYRCASESQAKNLAAILSKQDPGPRSAPSTP